MKEGSDGSERSEESEGRKTIFRGGHFSWPPGLQSKGSVGGGNSGGRRGGGRWWWS